MDNLGLELLRKEIEDVKDVVDKRTDSLGAMLVFAICLMIILVIMVGYLLYKYSQYLPYL